MKKILALTLTLILALSLFTVASSAEDLGADSATTEAVKLDKTGWILTSTSEMDSWSAVGKMADGNPKTYWHSKYTAEGSKITSKEEPPYTLEITFPKVEMVNIMEYLPRQDAQTGRWLEFEIYASESGSDKGLLIKKATFDHTISEAQAVDFGKTVSAKKITIIVTKTAGNYGTCAEIDFLYKKEDVAKTEDKKLDKEGWVLTSTSEMDSWSAAGKMADGNEKTYWHSKYTAEGSKITSKEEPPYTLEITFPKVEEINTMEYLPRQDSQNGRWLEFEIYSSENGADKGDFVKKATFVHTETDWQTVNFGKTVSAKKITIIVTKTAGNYGTCAEIEFIYKKNAVIEEVTEEVTEEKTEKPDSKKFDMSKWIITANSEKAGGEIRRAFDGNPATYWHSDYEAENGKILSHDMPPYEVDIKLPELTVITGFKATPRRDNTAGKIKSYRLYASREDEGELTLLMEGELASILGTEVIDFACGIEVKRIRFEILEGHSGYGTLAELEFVPGNEDTILVSYEDFDRTMNENILHKIDPSTIKAENDLPTWANTNVATIVNGQMWQTAQIPKGEPAVIAIDLGEVKSFNAMSVHPRQSSDYHGYWLKFNILASADGEDYFTVVENYSFPEKSFEEKFIYFDESVTARYVEIEVTDYVYGRVSCQGLYFWQSYADKTKSSDGGKFIMQIGSNEIKVEKNGESYTKTIDVAPYITSAGSTLIPLRGLLEEMGAEISWNGDNQAITIEKGFLKIELQIQNELVYVDDPIYGNTMYTLNSAPRIKDSRTFIPVRFVSEMLGYNVSWDGVTKTITIEK